MKLEQILQKLISISSVSGNEDLIQKFIFKYIKSYGLRPIFVGKNVAVKIKGKNNKNCLIFNSHVDTVPAGNLASWQTNPLGGVIKDNKIYGLGASDEKASVAIFLKLVEICSKEKSTCDLWITFVVNEEVDGSGTEEFIKYFDKFHGKEYQNVAGILGEPTNLEEIQIGHKGNLFLKVTVFGDSGHGSEPNKIKKHAILTSFETVYSLKELNKLFEKYKNNFLGSPTISLTAISGGDEKSPNKFADSCSLIFDIRTIPEVHEKAFELIETEISKIDSEAKLEYLYPPASFGFTDVDEDIVKTFQKVSKAVIGASVGSNDMCFFSQKGIPCVVFGAGDKNCIHKPNEFCEIENLHKCFEIYQKVISEWGCLK